jgi:transposase
MNIKFLVKLGKSGSESREMLVQVYRDNAMKKTAVYKWVTRFSEGTASVTDKGRWSAMSRTEENIAKVHQIVRENRWLTVRSITEQANIDIETVRKILTEDLLKYGVGSGIGVELPKGGTLKATTVIFSNEVLSDHIYGCVVLY